MATAAAKNTTYQPVLVTPPFRGSYAHLTTPQAMEQGQEPKFSITCVLSKKDPTTMPWLKTLQAAMAKAILDGFGKPLTPAQCKHYPLQDGDKKNEVSDELNEYLAGSYFFKMANTKRPECIDTNRQLIIDPDALYSGAWYRASFQPYFWNNTFGRGVSLSLCNVMKIKDDEKISSRPKAEDDFADFLGAAPAAGGSDDLLDLGGGAAPADDGLGDIL